MYDTIMDDTELEDVTKHAMKEAEDTKVRLDHQNKVRVEKKVVLDFDPETNAKLVTVHDRIATKLYMYDVCLESIKRFEDHPVAVVFLLLAAPRMQSEFNHLCCFSSYINILFFSGSIAC